MCFHKIFASISAWNILVLHKMYWDTYSRYTHQPENLHFYNTVNQFICEFYICKFSYLLELLQYSCIHEEKNKIFMAWQAHSHLRMKMEKFFLFPLSYWYQVLSSQIYLVLYFFPFDFFLIILLFKMIPTHSM
jgi:hypothetical protein